MVLLGCPAIGAPFYPVFSGWEGAPKIDYRSKLVPSPVYVSQATLAHKDQALFTKRMPWELDSDSAKQRRSSIHKRMLV